MRHFYQQILFSVFVLTALGLRGQFVATWDGDAGNGRWSTATNWVGNTLPQDFDDVFFQIVSPATAQTISLNGNRTVRSLNFDSTSDYLLQNNTFIFDTNRGGNLAINVSNVNGNADYTIDSIIEITDDLLITQGGTGNLTIEGNIDQSGNQINVSGAGNTLISGAVTNGGAFVKSGSGDLSLTNGNNAFSSLTLNAGSITVDVNGGINIGGNFNSSYLGKGPVTVNDGTLSVTSTNSSIRLRSSTFTQNSGTTIINAGDGGRDDFRVDAGASLDINGGTFSVVDADWIILNDNVSVNDGLLNLTARTSIFLNPDDALDLDNATVTMNAGSISNLRGNITMTDSVIDVQSGNVLLERRASVTGGEIKFADDLRIDSRATLSNLDLTSTAAGNNQISSGNGNQSFTGIDTLTINNATGVTTTINTNIVSITANQIDIVSGTLRWTDNNQIGDSTNVNLAGGTLDTNGFNDQLGALSLSADSILAVGGNSITFSSVGTWSGGTLSITGWDGNTDVFINGGITESQLSQIVFINPVGFAPGTYGANLIGNEIVPVPEVSQIIAGIGLLAAGAWVVFRRRKSRVADA